MQEGNGESVLKNLRSIFAHTKNAKLIEHSWLPHDQFLDLLDTMHIGLQVTYTETFNIVSADIVTGSIPIVVSSEIDWVDDDCKADPNDSNDIVHVMERVLSRRNKDDLCHSNAVRLKNIVKKNGEFWKQWP